MKMVGHGAWIPLSYTLIGAYLLESAYFSPWWIESWVLYAGLFGWVGVGIAYNPYRSLELRFRSSGNLNRIAFWIRRWPVLCLSLLLFSPIIAWVTRFWWFFPWLPWWSLAPYWIVRECLLATLFAVSVRAVFRAWDTGRQVCILLGFLFLSHLTVVLTYAAISGGPDYLQDGETQKCFLMQLWFKLFVGVLVFLVPNIRRKLTHS